MPRSLSSRVVSGMFAPETDLLVLACLEIYHADFDTIRIVNNTEAVTVAGNVFSPFPFSVTLPPEGEDAAPVAKATVSNIDRSVVEAARTVAGSTSGRAGVNLYTIDFDDPDTILDQLTGRQVQNLQYGADHVTFDMTQEFFTNEPYPALVFRPGAFPGLF